MAVAVGRPSNEELRNLSLSGHVGFDSLPDQLVNKSTSQGFCFNILCVALSPKSASRIHVRVISQPLHHNYDASWNSSQATSTLPRWICKAAAILTVL
ncbi:septin-11-like, partial [Leptonychotes weddellii]|uniref:Septin-11-like n=1 Tax=Leptonychotes weddellii TaxID=9713 RepID=A0A2U3Y8Y5_LEPWE